MKPLFFISTYIMLLISCAMDYTASAEIENLSGGSLRITIFYNRHFIDSAYQRKKIDHATFLKYAGDRTGLPGYEIDTVRLTVVFLVDKNKKLMIAHVPGGRNVIPVYDDIDSIQVLSHYKKLSFPGKDFTKTFQKRAANYWVWEIQQ